MRKEWFVFEKINKEKMIQVTLKFFQCFVLKQTNDCLQSKYEKILLLFFHQSDCILRPKYPFSRFVQSTEKA